MARLFFQFSFLSLFIPSNVCIFPSFECEDSICWCVDPTTGIEIPDSRYYQSFCSFDPTLNMRCEPECVALNCSLDEVCFKTSTRITCECKRPSTRISGVCQLGQCQKCISPTNDPSCPANIKFEDCNPDGTYRTTRDDSGKLFCADKVTGQLTRISTGTDQYYCEDWCYNLRCGENEECSATDSSESAGECSCKTGYVRSNERCVPRNFVCNGITGYCWCISNGLAIRETKLESIEGYPICEPWCLELKCGIAEKCHMASNGVKSCVCRKSLQQMYGSCSDIRWYRETNKLECKSCSRTARTCPDYLKDDDEFAAKVLCNGCPPPAVPQPFTPPSAGGGGYGPPSAGGGGYGPPSAGGGGFGSASGGVGGCGLNEVPAKCACEKTCTNSNPKCPSPCKAGCVCSAGLIRKGNLCVPPALCKQTNPPGC